MTVPVYPSRQVFPSGCLLEFLLQLFKFFNFNFLNFCLLEPLIFLYNLLSEVIVVEIWYKNNKTVKEEGQQGWSSL